MAIKQKIKEMLGEISDRYYIMRAKSVEIEKYCDSHREKIMVQKPLSNQEKAEIDKFYQENYGGFHILGINTTVLLRENLM